MNRLNNLENRLAVSYFHSVFGESSTENSLINKYSSKEELELLSNFERAAIEAIKEFDGYRSYLLGKAAQIDELYNPSRYIQ